mgnify:CR=1 FL=1
MYTPKYFRLEELVPPDVFELGEQAWQFFNPTALKALDNLRIYFDKPITVNNWHVGGQFKYRGFRPQECGVGAPNGEHYKGNAFDCDIKGMTAEEARQEILANQEHELLKDIMRMEDGVNWLHFDCKPVEKRIKVFKP